MPKLQSNCRYCKRKNSLISIFTLVPKTKTKHFRALSYEYSTHSDKTAFYICRKCGFHQNFRLNKLRGFMFQAYFPKSDIEIKALQRIQGQKDPYCIYCESKEDPPRPRKNTEYKSTMLKLFAKKPKRLFLGYFCGICRIAYYQPKRIIKWEKSEFYKNKLVDLLNPLNAHLTENEKKEHPKFNAENKLIEDKRKLACIGSFTTTEGVSFGEPENTHTIKIPKRNYQKVMVLLKKYNCEILN